MDTPRPTVPATCPRCMQPIHVREDGTVVRVHGVENTWQFVHKDCADPAVRKGPEKGRGGSNLPGGF